MASCGVEECLASRSHRPGVWYIVGAACRASAMAQVEDSSHLSTLSPSGLFTLPKTPPSLIRFGIPRLHAFLALHHTQPQHPATFHQPLSLSRVATSPAGLVHSTQSKGGDPTLRTITHRPQHLDSNIQDVASTSFVLCPCSCVGTIHLDFILRIFYARPRQNDANAVLAELSTNPLPTIATLHHSTKDTDLGPRERRLWS